MRKGILIYVQCNHHLRNASLQTWDIQLKDEHEEKIEKLKQGIQGEVSTLFSRLLDSGLQNLLCADLVAPRPENLDDLGKDSSRQRDSDKDEALVDRIRQSKLGGQA